MTCSIFKVDTCTRSSSTIRTQATLHLYGRVDSYLGAKGRGHPSKRLRPSFLSSLRRINRCPREPRPARQFALVCSLSEDGASASHGSPSTDWADGGVERLGNGWGGAVAAHAEQGHVTGSPVPGTAVENHGASAHDQTNGESATLSTDAAPSSPLPGPADTASSARAAPSPSVPKERRASGMPPSRRKQDGTFLGNTLALLLAGGCALALAGSSAVRGGVPATGTIAAGSGADSYTTVATTASAGIPPSAAATAEAGPLRTARSIAQLWANRPKIGLNAVIPDEVLAQGESALRTIQRKLMEPGRQAAMKKLPKSPTVAPDALQVDLLAAMQAAGVVEPGVLGHDMCLKRQYARWLLTSSTKLYRGQLTQRVLPATLATALSDVRAFDDVPPTDPDYESIQGLAEAGIFPSRLTVALPAYDKSTAVKPRAPQPKRPVFNPDQPLSREDLLRWKAALEHQRLPGASVEAVRQKLGFLDAANMSDSLQADLLLDHAYGDKSVVTRAFGYTRLFNPNKSVTIYQAASALASGKAAQMLAATDGLVSSTSTTTHPRAAPSSGAAPTASNNPSAGAKGPAAANASESAASAANASESAASASSSKSSQSVGDVANVATPSAPEGTPSAVNVAAWADARGSSEQRARDAATGADASRRDCNGQAPGGTGTQGTATRLHSFHDGVSGPDTKAGAGSTDIVAVAPKEGGVNSSSNVNASSSSAANAKNVNLSSGASPSVGSHRGAASTVSAAPSPALGGSAGTVTKPVDPAAAVATPLAAAAAVVAGIKAPTPVVATPAVATPRAALSATPEGSVGASNRASAITRAPPAGKDVARPAPIADASADAATQRKQHHVPPVPPVVQIAAQATAVNAIAPVVPEALPQPSMAQRILDHIMGVATPSSLPLPAKEAPAPKADGIAAQVGGQGGPAAEASKASGGGVSAPVVLPAQVGAQVGRWSGRFSGGGWEGG
eukprot:jgi/Mesvir1/29619/Mv21472-RA.3